MYRSPELTCVGEVHNVVLGQSGQNNEMSHEIGEGIVANLDE